MYCWYVLYEVGTYIYATQRHIRSYFGRYLNDLDDVYLGYILDFGAEESNTGLQLGLPP